MNPSENALTPAGSPYIKEVNAQNFMQEVIQASLQTPVLVYFTAAWCAPCKQYGPTLEKVVNEAKGRVRLARIDVDKNPGLAQQFRVQSLPMVYIFLQGQPLDAIPGALPESQLKELVAQLLGAAPADEATVATLETAAQLLAEGQAEAAAEAYQAILAETPENLEAVGGLARSFIAQKEFIQAEALLAQVPEEKRSHEAITAARAALTLAQSAPVGADAAKLQAAVTANPQDFDARYALAGVLFAQGAQEEAINHLLAIIAKNRDWNEGAARARLLTFFEALGHTHPLTMQGRRKLSSVLFS